MPKKRINSRQKGAQGEREFRDFVKSFGYDCRRGQQFSGGPSSPDIVCPDLGSLHFEVKRAQQLNIEKALGQATRDGGPLKIPLVAHRRNGEDWKITLWAKDFFEEFVKLFVKHGQEAKG